MGVITRLLHPFLLNQERKRYECDAAAAILAADVYGFIILPMVNNLTYPNGLSYLAWLSSFRSRLARSNLPHANACRYKELK